MLDIWYTFPATMGEDQAWISYNHGYGEVAESDPRHNVLRIKLPLKNPSETGMPTNEEYPQLSIIDEMLDEKFSEVGGVYVGRLTVDGHRFFYFYLNIEEKQASEIIAEVTAETSYQMQYVHEKDTDKKFYWEQLYPTDDDWQVIQDLKVLDSLSENGDMKDKEREVMHWAYFPSDSSCNHFAAWAKSENYELHFTGKDEDSSECYTKFTHVGAMHLGNITSHTIKLGRKARELGGRYDGWETSVEKK